MEKKAIARFIPFSTRKVNQVLKIVRGRRLDKVYSQLQFINKQAKTVIEKTIKSAHSNFGKGTSPEKLWLKACWVGQGPPLKRFRAAAMGRGVMYKKKTSHLFVVVSDTYGTKS